MMYTFKKHVQEKVGAELKKEIVTVEVTYANGSTSEHGFLVAEGETAKEAASRGATMLSKILVEPVVVIVEEVEVAEEDKEIVLNGDKMD